MGESLASLFSVTIDFDQSHWYFPRIVIASLIIMLVWIALANLAKIKAVLSGEIKLRFFEPDADFYRLIVTLILIPVYFVAMDQIGQLIPNMGMGFLLSSIPFMFIMSFVYLHDRSKRHMIMITANALIMPVFVWFLLGEMFNISLP
jgi:hypothetical protein